MKDILKKDKFRFYSFLLIFAYLFFALVNINHPGVQYDEMQFGNIATGGKTGAFVWYSFHGVPLLMMSYVGALKAYLFYPIFKIFGVSIYSIRVPMVFFAALSLCFFYSSLKIFFNRKVAVLALLFICLDSSFASFTRYDVGPTVIELVCKIFVLYFFALSLVKKEKKCLFLIYLFLLLGLFNKLSFIWFVNGFFAAAIISFWKDWVDAYEQNNGKRKIFTIIFIAVSYMSLVFYFLYLSSVYKSFNSSSISEIIHKIIPTLYGIKNLITGESFYNYAFGVLSVPVTKYILVLMVTINIFGFTYAIISKNIDRKFRRNYLFFSLILFFIVSQIIITKEAKYPWHFFSIYPMYIVIFCCSIFLMEKFISSYGAIIKRIAMSTVIIIVSYELSVSAMYVQAYNQTPKNFMWSNSIFDLIKYAKDSNHKFASVDWGTHIQLLTFDGRAGKYSEMAPALHNEETFKKTKEFLFETYFKPEGEYYFILHPKGKSLYEDARENFFNLAKDKNVKLTLDKTFFDNNGEPVFEIYYANLK
jgi:hypothetical protein